MCFFGRGEQKSQVNYVPRYRLDCVIVDLDALCNENIKPYVIFNVLFWPSSSLKIILRVVKFNIYVYNVLRKKNVALLIIAALLNNYDRTSE